MADDSRVPPLSRRVPGATNRPKPKMRIAPPVLPEDLVGRLRPGQAAAVETTPTAPRRISGEVPTADTQVATVAEAVAEEPETWYVVPDSPASPVADSNDTTQPIPVIAAASEKSSAVKVRVDTRKEQLPRRGGSRPAGQPRPAEASGSAVTQTVSRTRRPDTQPAARPEAAGLPEAGAGPAAARGRPEQAAIWRKWAAWLSLAASRSGADLTEQPLLRPLFRESLSIEEMVASVRAQDAGRRADQSRRYRMAAAVVLIVVVATAVVVVAVI